MPPVIPPALSAESAARMQAAVGRADDLVDAGHQPAAAIAKAAAETGLPVGHLPQVVRAFNTGRAVRQLGEADPWAKAAAYPTADVAAVTALLTAPPVPQKVASAPLADYAPPPQLRADPTGLLPLVPAEKRAALAVRATPAPRQPWPGNGRPKSAAVAARRIDAFYSAAAAYDAVGEAVAALAPRTYAGVKAAALTAHPEAAAYVFGRLEAGDPGLLTKAAAVPDAAVTVRHPVVALVGKVAEARASAQPTTPDPATPIGFRKLAGGWLTAAPVPEAKNLGIPLPLPTPISPAVTAGLTISADAVKAAGAPVAAAGFGGGFRSLAVGVPKAIAGNPFVGKALDYGPPPEDGHPPPGLSGASAKLEGGLNQLDQQAAVQDMLADPRFAKADPKLVVDTWRQLSQIAPSAMKNTAVASDFVNRRLTTGPLGAYDLKLISELEKNLVQSRRMSSEDGDD